VRLEAPPQLFAFLQILAATFSSFARGGNDVRWVQWKCLCILCEVLETVRASLAETCSTNVKLTTVCSVGLCDTQRKDNINLYSVGRDSRYSDSLRAGRSGDRIPVEARFSAPVQTGPGAHPASCTVSTGSFPGG
jgi:hypothetical protein